MPRLGLVGIHFERLKRRMLVSWLLLGSITFFLLTPGASVLSASFELRTERCPVLHDVFESMITDHARRGLVPIHHGILDRLTRVDLETIKRFFQCFQFQEETVDDSSRQKGIVRILSTVIVVGKAKLAADKDDPTNIVELPVYAIVACTQKSDGTLFCWGAYHIE